MNNKFSLIHQGQKLEGFAQHIQGQLWIHIQGQTYCVESSKSNRRRRGAEGRSTPHQVMAPMPGKITKIFVREGESVTIGQALVVMEAMKMEYTLKSEMETVVEKIQAKVGDQVQLGQLLVKLKEITA